MKAGGGVGEKKRRTGRGCRRRGLFITFEGGEGCGKSTHSALLYDYLRARGIPCVRTFEPGGTTVGKAIRRILLDPANTGLGVTAELLLFEASRAQLIGEVIAPALAAGAVVLCDRFTDATIAYQVYGGGMPLAAVRDIERWSVNGVCPDKTFLLEVSVSTGLARAKGEDRFERKERLFHQRVQQGYRALARECPGRFVRIRTGRSIELTQRTIRTAMERLLEGWDGYDVR